jgi:hypothetical protein
VLLIVTLTNTLNLSFFSFQKYLFTASVEVNLVILSTMMDQEYCMKLLDLYVMFASGVAFDFSSSYSTWSIISAKCGGFRNEYFSRKKKLIAEPITNRFRLRSNYYNYMLGLLPVYCTAGPLLRLVMGFSIFNLDGQIRFAPFEVSFFFFFFFRIFLIICFLSLSRKW